MAIEILKAGLLTTIQDLGRVGFRKAGIISSGAMDKMALRIGNLLIGNIEEEAGLECTLLGPEIRFLKNTSISIVGGNLSPQINGLEVQMWTPINIISGDILQFGGVVSGCRSYVCISGGLDIAVVLNSKSTYLSAGFGGFKGRRVHKNDVIPIKEPIFKLKEPRMWFVADGLYPNLKQSKIRVIKGPEYDWFTEHSLKQILKTGFSIGSESNRMGYHLNSRVLEKKSSRELLSSAVTFGTIQVSHDGHLILLMADHQTTGGYPRVFQVATIDFTILAQAKADSMFSIEIISQQEAHFLLTQKELQINKLKHTLQFKLNPNEY